MLVRKVVFIVLISTMVKIQLRIPCLVHFWLSIISNKEKEWLYHHRLNHLSFYMIKMMSSCLFQELTVESFHWIIVKLQNINAFPFQTVTKDVKLHFLLFIVIFGLPSAFPNISSARWFLSFIDDCTRLTWIYLLNQKSKRQSNSLYLF